MKYLYGFLSLIVLVLVFSIAWSNSYVQLMIFIPFFNGSVVMSSFLYALLLGFLGFVAGALLTSTIALHQKNKISPYKKQLEKISVQKDANDSRVEVLEEKIKTLELALKNSIESK